MNEREFVRHILDITGNNANPTPPRSANEPWTIPAVSKIFAEHWGLTHSAFSGQGYSGILPDFCFGKPLEKDWSGESLWIAPPSPGLMADALQKMANTELTEGTTLLAFVPACCVAEQLSSMFPEDATQMHIAPVDFKRGWGPKPFPAALSILLRHNPRAHRDVADLFVI